MEEVGRRGSDWASSVSKGNHKGTGWDNEVVVG